MQDEAKVRNLSPKTQATDPFLSQIKEENRIIFFSLKKKFSTEECLHSSDAMRQEQEKLSQVSCLS